MNENEMKNILRKAKIPQWRLAKQLGLCENTINRKLRDLSDKDAADMLRAIEEIQSAEKKA